ncbi:MAG TPA: hypothetical protein VMP11_10565 [Verrucomicrobiae bacterium]|nr:hypothetical protein [Verrucomicrobiae bacterium]
MTRKSPRLIAATIVSMIWVVANCRAQVNSGSTGSDGALIVNASTNINMSDHPTGIYNYTSINVSSNVTVTFTPNANNTPVVWLVQSTCIINGTVDVSGQTSSNSIAGIGGPGGWNGGNGGSAPMSGSGPGGGPVSQGGGWASGSYNYGNSYLIPLLGGSGGGALTNGTGGGGGGGAILIAASQSITVGGNLRSVGGQGVYVGNAGIAGGGSGGAIRLVASRIDGHGNISFGAGYPGYCIGPGRGRFDTYDNSFAGNIDFGGCGSRFSMGSQFVIIPVAGQLPQLTVTSVGGVPVSASPTGVLSTPDAVISAQQTNPIPIVVQCSNIPLNTPITVSVTPMNGSPVSAVGYNSTGTLASSTATISIVMPRGGGLIYATAATSN